MDTNEKLLESDGNEESKLGELSASEQMSFSEASNNPDTTILADLSDLGNLTFGTRWSQDELSRPFSGRPRHFSKPSSVRNRHFEGKENRKQNDANNRSDSVENRKRNFSEERYSFSSHSKEQQRRYRPFFPSFEVQFYQEDRSFNLLLDEMRKNCKTYELFTIAQLILQKPERFAVTICRQSNSNGIIEPLYLSLLDDLVFESEREAIAYIMQHHIEEFFDVLEETVEPPKGRFTCIHRCGITKKLLSPPNYHKYKAILHNHFCTEIYGISFERFVDKIETTKEENDIQTWLQRMSRKITYTPNPIDESVTDLAPLDSLEGVKNYLLKYFKERIVREIMTARIAGIHIKATSSKPIVRAIQFFLQKQRHFPLDTANNLRNRFRRVGFGIYRKGKQGISYVCAAKRKFRTDTDVFEPNIQGLITFLEPLDKVTLERVKREYIEANHSSEKEVLDSLNWLIQEGYVVEYENGELFLNPKLVPFSKDKTNQFNSEENAIIPLENAEVAIEKLSDGTLAIAPETILAIPEHVNNALTGLKIFSEANLDTNQMSDDTNYNKDFGPLQP